MWPCENRFCLTCGARHAWGLKGIGHQGGGIAGAVGLVAFALGIPGAACDVLGAAEMAVGVARADKLWALAVIAVVA